MARTLEELAQSASEDAVRLARTVLEQNVADKAWGDQIGPCLTQRDVAQLLEKTEQAVSQDGRLVRLHNRDGRPVYPLVQFDGRQVLPGIDRIVAALQDAVEPLTIASWLTARSRALEQTRPVDAIRLERVEEVVRLAQRFAHRASV